MINQMAGCRGIESDSESLGALTFAEHLDQDFLVLSLRQIWRQVAHEHGNARAVNLVLRLQVESRVFFLAHGFLRKRATPGQWEKTRTRHSKPWLLDGREARAMRGCITSSPRRAANSPAQRFSISPRDFLDCPSSFRERLPGDVVRFGGGQRDMARVEVSGRDRRN